MGEKIKKTGNEALKRWKEKMPKFFKVLMNVFICIGGAVITVHIAFNQLGIVEHEWWTDIKPLVLGISIGGAFACKFTCDGGFREKSIDKINKTILDKDDN